jgi:RNA 2',3'-cyclic 3'-phosphodiesterase
MRLFVSVNLPEAFAESLTVAIESIKDSFAPLGRLRWNPPGHLHFTLKFLGECSEDKGEALHRGIASALQGARRWRIDLQGLGRFPERGKPQVLWLGASGEEMRALARRLDDACAPLGFKPETRAFHAHVTIARIEDLRDPRRFSEQVEALARHPFGSFDVERIYLMRSRLSPHGSLYSVEQSFNLGDVSAAK